MQNEDSSKQKEGDRLSRRFFLETALAGLATISGHDASWTERLDPDTDLITRDEAAAVYTKLYDYIDTEKKAAEVKGQKFVLLMGDAHYNRNSLMLELMIIDIAQRLGISDMFIETDQKDTTNMVAAAKQLLDARDKHAEYLLNGEAKHDAVIKTRVLGQYIDLNHDQMHNTSDLYTKYSTIKTINYFAAVTSASDLGMKIHAGDPDHKKRLEASRKHEDDSLKAEFEDRMHENLMGVAANRSTLALYGAAHVPELIRRLEKRNVHAVGIDCTVSFMKYQQENHTIPPETMSRMERMKQSFQPGVASRINPTSGHAMRLTFYASLLHRAKSGELGSHIANNFTEMLAKELDANESKLEEQYSKGK